MTEVPFLDRPLHDTLRVTSLLQCFSIERSSSPLADNPESLSFARPFLILPMLKEV